MVKGKFGVLLNKTNVRRKAYKSLELQTLVVSALVYSSHRCNNY